MGCGKGKGFTQNGHFLHLFNLCFIISFTLLIGIILTIDWDNHNGNNPTIDWDNLYYRLG